MRKEAVKKFGIVGYHEIFENKKPQIKRPESRLWRACPRMPSQGIRVRGVENMQGFGLDERRFMIAYLRLFAFICCFFEFNTKRFYTHCKKKSLCSEAEADFCL